ncbi:DinB family protein [Promineifilum sp.]|uniref:DinB family protein n=1 Tax=Promineifilum sp. TaxID=2664178 RepID=UPI0035B27940
MNQIMTGPYGLFRLYQRLRDHLLAVLIDDDLAFTPGGANPTLGQLCVEMGETQRAYVGSFRSFEQAFAYGLTDPALAGSVAGLRAWYEQLDADLLAAVEALRDEDIANRPIDRGHGFLVPANVQLEIYKEALLIFYGKVSVYLKLLGKTPSEQWSDWIA